MLSEKQLERSSQYYRKGYLDAWRNWHGPRQLQAGTFAYCDYFNGVAAGANDKYWAENRVYRAR